MNDCLFCKIANKEIPSDLVLETDTVIAFRDINPQAPQHILVIPRKHIPTVNDLDIGDKNLVGEMVTTARDIARENGIAESGYRIVLNCNKDGGQAVYHIHIHLMGGREMNWPPG